MLALVFVLPTVVTGRIPLVHGVIGGVGSSDLSRVKTPQDAADANPTTARTPGKLRVVEDSGVCGECSLSSGHYCVHNSGRNYATRLSSLWIWGPCCEQEHLVRVAL